MATVFKTPADLEGAVGQHLGCSDWLEIEQDRIDKFAEATGDHQWIHVDPKKRQGRSVRQACIAHGYLTQSLVNYFLPQIVDVQGISMGVNYGADKLRFPAPVPVGSRIRGAVQSWSSREDQRWRRAGDDSRHGGNRGWRPPGLRHRHDQPLLPRRGRGDLTANSP